MKRKSLALLLSLMMLLSCITSSMQGLFAAEVQAPHVQPVAQTTAAVVAPESVVPSAAAPSTAIPSAAIAPAVTLQAAADPLFNEVYEAEDAELTGCAIGAVLDDFSGRGYVDGLPQNAKIAFQVHVAAAGEYGVRLRYTNGTGATRSVSVYVNGTKIRNTSLARTINDTTWNIQLENLKLNAGDNTIIYQNELENNCAEVRFDKISLSWMYEAENTEYATRVGGIGQDVDDHPGYSGTKGNSDIAFQVQGQGLRFAVNVPAAGEYAMVIRYGCGFTDANARSLSLYVNNTKIKTLQFATMRNWDLWTDFRWNIKLNEGQNTVTLQVDSGNSATLNIDYITLKPVQWTYAGAITEILGNNSSTLTFKLDNAEVQLKSVDKNAVKVWLEPDGKYIRRYESFSVIDEAVDPQNLNAVDKESYYEIDTGAMLMRIQKNPFKITYLDKAGNVLCENENQSMGWSTDGELMVNSKLQRDEQFWGLGEKLAQFNRRGTSLTMWSHDAYGDILNSSVPESLEDGRYYFSNPYFVSSKGYSVLFDNSSRTVFDLGKSSDSTYSFGTHNPNPGNELVYYFIYGPEPKQLTKTFTDIIGKSFFAPEWAYGNIQCHYGYRQTDVENTAQTYRDKKIPLDMMMADIEWYETQCSPTVWNRSMFPDPESMLAKLKALNVRMGLIDDPNISAVVRNGQTPPDYVQGNANGYFVKDHAGQTKLIHWPWGQSFGNRGSGDSGLTDFFNPGARKWWGELHNMVLNQGVESFWLDMNEPAKYNMDWLFWNEPGKAYGTISEVKNAFAIMHHQSMFDKLHEEGNRSLMLSRSGYTGSQRYVSPWTGDIGGDYNSLAQQINLGISLSMTGYNYWGFDIGGFFGSIDNKLYKRWIELACFTPIHRFHYASGVEAKEPWTHNSEDVSRKYINLRYTLKPYMYALTADNILGIGIEKGLGSGGTGVPYVRPMVMEYPNDMNTYNMDTQFMAGPSFLVAPVVSNADTKQVYLPEGKWYDYFSAPLIYDGNQTITYEAPEEVLPLFVKEGSIIPMYPLMQYNDEKPVDVLTLDIYPTVSDGSFGFVLYEDDGETDKYITDNVFTTTAYNCNVRQTDVITTYTLDIGARKGAYTDIAPRDYCMQFHNGYLKNITVKHGESVLLAKASLDALNDSAHGYYLDSLKNICYVKVNDTGLAATVTVSGVKVEGGSLEFEDGILSGGAVAATTDTGYSGDGYVTGLNTEADTASVDFVQTNAGLYPVYIRYRSLADTTLSVTTGGEKVEVALSGRAETNCAWEETVALLNLQKGANRVTVAGTGRIDGDAIAAVSGSASGAISGSTSGTAMIDCLRIADSEYELPQYVNLIEAEDSILFGGVRTAASTSGYSGTGYVTGISATNAGVTFEGVKVREAGRYTVKLRYRNDNATTRTLHIYPNDQSDSAVVIRLPRIRQINGVVTWGETQVSLPLQQGENVITVIQQSGDSGSNIFIDNLYYSLEILDLEEVSVANGGFETGNTNGWTLNPVVSGSYGVDTGDAILERYKFYTYNNGRTTVQKLYQTVNDLTNGSYLVEFWAKLYNSAPNVCQLQLEGYDGNATLNYDIRHDPEWIHYSFPVEVKDGSLTLGFYHDAPPTSSLQLDDVKLWRVVSYNAYIKDALEAAIIEGALLKRADYTAPSFNPFQAAMQLAKKWFNDPTATLDNYASALDLLEKSKADLVPYGLPPVPVFTDDTGAVVNPLSTDTLNVSLGFTNTACEAKSLTMYVAVYTGEGLLQHVASAKVDSIAAGDAGVFDAKLNMPENVDGSFMSDGHSICVFLWDSYSHVPVIAAMK